MKKLIISMFALAAVLSSCSKSEVMDSRYENIPISFTTYNGRTPEVKATEVTTTTMPSFTVIAENNGANYFTDDYTSTGFAGGEKYWPGENPLDFYAFSPVQSVTEAETMVSLSGTTLTLTVPTYAEDQQDVVVAVAKNQTQSTATITEGTGEGETQKTGVVTLNFKHILSRIHFAVEIDGSANADITIDDLKLLGTFKTTGSVNLKAETPAVVVDDAYATITQSAYTYGYTATEGETKFKISDEGAIYTDEPENRYFMIIPQTMTSASIAVTYTFNGVTTAYTGEEGANQPIALPANFVFEPGKSYLYTLKIATNAISFKVSVDEWDDETNTNSDSNIFELY